MPRIPASSYSVVLVLVAGLTWGCATTKTARLYDLDSARVLRAVYEDRGSGRGPITMESPDGVTCEGEYSTVARGSIGWGTIFATAQGQGGTASGTGSVIALEIENAQRGMAIATCTDSVVIECEYLTSRAGGYGGCRDNNGRRYRLMF